MLQPNRRKYRKEQKGRNTGIATRGAAVSFGDFGLKATERGRLTARQIEAARRAISRHIKRGGRIFIRIFPDKPISQKPAEVRMGNGKGNPEYYVAEIQPGKVLYEINGVPEALAREAFQLASAKLPLREGSLVDGLIADFRSDAQRISALNAPEFGHAGERLSEAVEALARAHVEVVLQLAVRRARELHASPVELHEPLRRRHAVRARRGVRAGVGVVLVEAHEPVDRVRVIRVEDERALDRARELLQVREDRLASERVPDEDGRGFGADGKSVYEEGIQIPIMKFAERGEVNLDLVRILRANVREPNQVVGDFYSLASCNDVGHRRLVDMMKEIGLASLDGLGEFIFSRTHQAMLERIKTLPRGRRNR